MGAVGRGELVLTVISRCACIAIVIKEFIVRHRIARIRVTIIAVLIAASGVATDGDR